MKVFRPDKKLKRKKQWQDYRKKANIIREQIKEINNGKRTEFSVFFPKKRKYATTI